MVESIRRRELDALLPFVLRRPPPVVQLPPFTSLPLLSTLFFASLHSPHTCAVSGFPARGYTCPLIPTTPSVPLSWGPTFPFRRHSKHPHSPRLPIPASTSSSRLLSIPPSHFTSTSDRVQEDRAVLAYKDQVNAQCPDSSRAPRSTVTHFLGPCHRSSAFGPTVYHLTFLLTPTSVSKTRSSLPTSPNSMNPRALGTSTSRRARPTNAAHHVSVLSMLIRLSTTTTNPFHAPTPSSTTSFAPSFSLIESPSPPAYPLDPRSSRLSPRKAITGVPAPVVILPFPVDLLHQPLLALSSPSPSPRLHFLHSSFDAAHELLLGNFISFHLTFVE